MARQKKKTEKASENVVDYRHKGVKRLNIPPAGLTARGEIVREKKVRYAYNPHLMPVLRFDATGKADSIKKLIDDASRRKLEPHEINLLQEAMRNHEPWLEWAGKREQQWCVADPVALHIHERMSTQAILRAAKREDVQRDLFADPEQEYREAVQFERLLDAIVPDEHEGEMPILPILNRYKAVGTTADVDFTTKRNVHSTQRSHVNAVVLDSSWEQAAAFYLEQQTDHVFCYVRNDRPFLLIPYEYEAVQHHYEPDYLVRLKNGNTLILETKGEEDDHDRAKYQAARRWVTAVNNWGRLGGWNFLVCRDPALIPRQIAQIAAVKKTIL